MTKHTNISVPAEIIIGKDVLELVSSAMYVDPLTIYREYIQNAADSIEEAKISDVLKPNESGQVDITLDTKTRSVKIRDNGIGIPNGDFSTRLTALGGSNKRGTSASGFRGIGRLSGLGYCQELVFRSRAVGDNAVQELRWDCRVFKKLLSDNGYQGDIHDIMNQVASVTELNADGWPEHFYEVELIKPVRIKNDLLMNQEIISHYLAQVAPVPFSPKFKYGKEIQSWLSMHLDLSEIHIFINDACDPIYRPYRNDYAYREDKKDTFCDPEFKTIEGYNGGVCAVAWVLHHGYHGALNKSGGINGLRARKENIQIGGPSIFSDAYPESRFSSWTVGEVHIVDEKIIPNGRRDDFEQNAHYTHLTSHLSDVGNHIARICRGNSATRNRIKSFDIGAFKIEEQLTILEQGAVGDSDARLIVEDIRSNMFEIQKTSISEALDDIDKKPLIKRFSSLENRINKIEKSPSQSKALNHLSKKESAIAQRIIGCIYECSQNRIVAKALVDRILVRLGE